MRDVVQINKADILLRTIDVAQRALHSAGDKQTAAEAESVVASLRRGSPVEAEAKLNQLERRLTAEVVPYA